MKYEKGMKITLFGDMLLFIKEVTDTKLRLGSFNWLNSDSMDIKIDNVETNYELKVIGMVKRRWWVPDFVDVICHYTDK